jgi:hypothetical protein
MLDINTIALELFDALGQELVIMNQRPKVSVCKR